MHDDWMSLNEDFYLTAFGNHLRALIEKAGYTTVQQFAQFMEFDYPSLTNILSGKRPPPITMLETWGTAFKLKPKQLALFKELGWLRRSPKEARLIVAQRDATIAKLKSHAN